MCVCVCECVKPSSSETPSSEPNCGNYGGGRVGTCRETHALNSHSRRLARPAACDCFVVFVLGTFSVVGTTTMSWLTAGSKRGFLPLNKDKVFSDLNALIDQTGGGASSNGRQQGSGARRRSTSKQQTQTQSQHAPCWRKATKTAAEWVCSKCKAPNWVTKKVCRSCGMERPCEGGRQTAPSKAPPANVDYVGWSVRARAGARRPPPKPHLQIRPQE